MCTRAVSFRILINIVLDDMAYSNYLDQYTQELAVALPVIMVLGFYTNKRFGSVYSAKLLLATYGFGFLLRYTGLGTGREYEGSSLNIAAALTAHTLFRVGAPFPAALACTLGMVPFTGMAGPFVGAMFALVF